MNRVNHPGSKGYLRKIRKVEPANLIGYWPMNEQSGDSARDWSGADGHGTHTAVGYMGDGIGDGMRCLAYDGTNSYTNIYSAALASAFNGAEGTLLIWAKVADAGVWTDGANREMVRILSGTDYVTMRKSSTNNETRIVYSAGGIVLDNAISTTSWFSLALTWSKSLDVVATYINGVPGTTAGSLVAWVGVPTLAVVGASSIVPADVFSGSLAHCALWSKALAAGDIKFLASI